MYDHLRAYFLVDLGTLHSPRSGLAMASSTFPEKASTSADRQRIDDVFRDDDQYWFGDFFYNNPDDPAVYVPKRFGMGWTVNFGNPRGKLFMIATLLLPLVIALLGILFPGIQAYGCHPSGCHPFP